MNSYDVCRPSAKTPNLEELVPLSNNPTNSLNLESEHLDCTVPNVIQKQKQRPSVLYIAFNPIKL